jgi:phosphoribosylaminoimidazole-succinocarboxamide synthase
MNNHKTLYHSNVPDLQLIGRGKVRDIYSIDKDNLLIVTTDRLSAYDVILPNPIPTKGIVLTQISNFWFRMMEDIIPNHLTNKQLNTVIRDEKILGELESRSIIVKKLNPLPIEAVVRSYLIGSGWRDYQATGKVCGIEIPRNIEQAGKLPETIFTPATKAPSGEHDENINFSETSALIGEELARQVRDISIAIYDRASSYASERGIIIADTKFEFGLDDNNKLYVIDEMLTPDSSRFWPKEKYTTGISPPSFDKQFVRDYLDTLDWNKKAPGPNLPEHVINKTRDKYQDAYKMIAYEN